MFVGGKGHVASTSFCTGSACYCLLLPRWIWMYWISPLAYAIRALVVNEMNTPDWYGPVSPADNQSIGDFAMEARGFQSQTWWV